jgi:hypothetical protein
LQGNCGPLPPPAAIRVPGVDFQQGTNDNDQRDNLDDDKEGDALTNNSMPPVLSAVVHDNEGMDMEMRHQILEAVPEGRISSLFAKDDDSRSNRNLKRFAYCIGILALVSVVIVLVVFTTAPDDEPTSENPDTCESNNSVAGGPTLAPTREDPIWQLLLLQETTHLLGNSDTTTLPALFYLLVT